METVRFEEMGLSEEIQKAVRYIGFEEPVRPQHSESRFWKR